jgi:tetratricopeptide (TPR) repeat protein
LEEYGRRIETALNVTEAHADPAVEIGLYDAFGHVAWHTRGDMHAMNVCFTKALAGAVRESDAESQYRALYGLIVYYATNGDYAEAVSTARQLGELAAAIGDPKKLVTHRRLSAVAATFAGEHDSVRSHAEYVLNHPSSASGATRPSGLFFDQRISARTMLARTLWQQGFADQARDCAQDGLELAQTTGHALSLCFVLAHAVTPIALWRGELARAAEMTDLLIKRSEEHGFFIWHEFGRAYRTVLQPDSADASFGPERPTMGALLLETLATLNEDLADDGILARAEHGVAGWCTPELFRIAGKRRLQRCTTDFAAAETLLIRAIDAARRQSALSWELRAVASLADVWAASSGRSCEAINLLWNVLDRFTEGFDTADFVRAASLLNELRTRRSSGRTSRSVGQDHR